jgi:uncharacterized protein (DUF1697 family)
MATHAAFLRGINLGNRRRVKNEQLRDAFEQAGFEDVATFRASGNVVLRAEEGLDDSEVRARAETGLADALGFEVAVFVRSVAELAAIAAREPFSKKELAASSGKQQVALLPSRPAAPARRKALALASEADRLAVEGSELHWLPRDRMSDSELDLRALESLLGPWTMRTKGTIEQIAARHCGG